MVTCLLSQVLDDIYQYHLPPNRRIPPLLWTRVRSDLPGYLADSEADGVCVINYYHKQFKQAAKKRYFLDDTDYLYFHSYMSDYFLGTYGGGILKPFRYTEIQKHTFNLKTKDDSKDRQVSWIESNCRIVYKKFFMLIYNSSL